MAGSADFKLIAGLEIDNSYVEMKKDINELIKKFKDDPVKLTFTIDPSSIEKIQKDIKEALSGSKLGTGVGLPIDAGAVKEVRESAKSLAQNAKQGFQDAAKAVRDYYSVLRELNKNSAAKSDVTLTGSGWVSQSGSFDELAAALNRTKTAFDLLTSAESKAKLSSADQIKLNALMAEEAQKYNLQIERTAAAERARADAAKASAAAQKSGAMTEVERNRALTQCEGLLQRVQRAQQDWTKAQKDSATRDAYNNLATYEAEIQKLISDLQSGNLTVSDFKDRFAKLNAQFAQSTTVIKGSGNAIKSWLGSGMTQLASRLTYTLSLANLVMKTIAEVKKMISTAIELDISLNQLQIVTHGSAESMAEYSKQVSQMAKETGQATKDLIDATTVYARLGYTMSESSQLAKYAAMLQGVGDIDASSAQDAMTAIIKAFGKNVDEVESVMDKLVVVGKGIAQSYGNVA